MFDRQIYFAEMEWGDESKKEWFKIAQPTIYLIKFTTPTMFRIFLGGPKRRVFLVRRLSKLGALWVYFPFLASLVVFVWTKEPLWFSQIPCLRNSPYSRGT